VLSTERVPNAPARLLDTLWIYHHNCRVKLSHSPVKPCLFVRPSRRELKALPEEVRGRIGHAVYQAQCGQEPASAKALKGFGGRGVLEVVEDFDGTPIGPCTRFASRG
jgi:hypothetical protein